jgi:hypothetical protein
MLFKSFDVSVVHAYQMTEVGPQCDVWRPLAELGVFCVHSGDYVGNFRLRTHAPPCTPSRSARIFS